AGTLEEAVASGNARAAEDGYRARLRDERHRDAAAGRTLAGPHLSDLRVRHAPKRMPAEACSTGEQKALLIGLVLSQARLVAELTVVVSPLIALVRDQVQQMRHVAIAAATLNSSNDGRETDEAWQLLDDGALRLLYVSPERLANSAFAMRLKAAGVKRLAIDEA